MTNIKQSSDHSPQAGQKAGDVTTLDILNYLMTQYTFYKYVMYERGFIVKSKIYVLYRISFHGEPNLINSHIHRDTGLFTASLNNIITCARHIMNTSGCLQIREEIL